MNYGITFIDTNIHLLSRNEKKTRKGKVNSHLFFFRKEQVQSDCLLVN